MNWKEKWKALSARIEGIKEAGKLMAPTLTLMSGAEDAGAVATKYINPELIKIRDELKEFLNNKDIPASALKIQEQLFNPLL